MATVPPADLGDEVGASAQARATPRSTVRSGARTDGLVRLWPGEDDAHGGGDRPVRIAGLHRRVAELARVAAAAAPHLARRGREAGEVVPRRHGADRRRI